MKINLGCGRDIKEGFDNIDLFHEDPRVIKHDIEKINEIYEENSIDYIIASDVIEHISHKKVKSILSMWISLLKPNGRIYIKTPDIRKQAECLINGIWDSYTYSHMVYGGQDTAGNYHMNGFTERDLKNLMINNGLSIENISFEHFRLTSDVKTSANANLIIVGVKNG